MEQTLPSTIGRWLEEKCREERLSLRKAADRTGLCHTTIADVIAGVKPSAATVRRLALGFGGNGHQGLALEDKLLVLAGYRRQRDKVELNEGLAQLLDKLAKFSEPELKLIESFADFISKLETRQ